MIAIVGGAGDAAAASRTAQPASVASGVCVSAARGTNTSSCIKCWEEGPALVAEPSSRMFSHNLLAVSSLLALIHPTSGKMNSREVRQRCIKSGPQPHSLGEWPMGSATAFLEGRGSALSPAPLRALIH